MPGPEGSITRWIHGVKGGDEDSARRLWDAYVDRLTRLARARLRPGHIACVVEDEEDAVVEAFESFCRGASGGRFLELKDRGDLWRLLAVITIRKVLDQKERRSSARRGGGRPAPSADPGADLDGVAGTELAPDVAAMLAEEYRLRIASLQDDQLRQIAIWKMEGYTDGEIASKLGCARRTVARRLELIRLRWIAEGSP